MAKETKDDRAVTLAGGVACAYSIVKCGISRHDKELRTIHLCQYGYKWGYKSSYVPMTVSNQLYIVSGQANGIIGCWYFGGPNVVLDEPVINYLTSQRTIR